MGKKGRPLPGRGGGGSDGNGDLAARSPIHPTREVPRLQGVAVDNLAARLGVHTVQVELPLTRQQGQRLVDHALADEQKGVVSDIGIVEQLDQIEKERKDKEQKSQEEAKARLKEMMAPLRFAISSMHGIFPW